LQDEVTTAIVGAIEPELLRSERDRIARRPLEREDSYELYQRGLWHFYRYTKEDSVEAQDLFRRALAIDAEYPQPVAQLAITLCNAAYVVLGQMHLYAGHPEEAIALAEKGIRLSPKDPRLFIWLAALAGAHYRLGHYTQTIEAGRRSWTLNRNWPAGLRYVVAGLAQLGRMEEARAALEELK